VYDLRDGALTVEMSPGGRVTGIAVREGALERVDPPVVPLRGGAALTVEDGELGAYHLDGEAELLGALATYDAEAHRHVRLREQAGRIYWESSPDGVAWTVLHDRAVTFDASAVRVELFGRGRGRSSLAWFDNLNTPATDVPLCPPDGLRDDFDDGAIALAWRRWFGAGECSVEEVDGRVELALTGSAYALCGLVSSRNLDFRDAALSFELATVPDDPAIGAFADLSHFSHRPASSTDRIEVRVVAGSLYMRITHKPSPQQSEEIVTETRADYDPVSMRHFRLRERAGRFYWESSPDGASWTIRAESDTTVDVSRVVFGLSAVKSTAAQRAVVRYDDVGP
jgi:hypothetical protein